jgi:hypothetical protein
MRTNINPGVVKYQAQCSCGECDKKHATATMARLGTVVHLAGTEVMGGTAGHNIGVLAVPA